MLTRGYWGMPAETERAFTGDGWLHTGDLVTVDPGGTYTFVARKKEVLRRRGENLSPAEVEEVLDEHPDVLECAVVGVPSELSEEEVKAFVVPVPGAGARRRRAACVHRRAAGRVQGAALLAADQRAAAHPDGPGGQAPAAPRAPAGGVGRGVGRAPLSRARAVRRPRSRGCPARVGAVSSPARPGTGVQMRKKRFR